jgi:hypothetical protein
MKNIQYSLAGLGRMTALRTQGRHGFDSIAGSGRRRLGEDDGTADPGRAWVIGVTSLGTAWGAQHRGLGEDDIVVGLGTASQAWGQVLHCQWRHRLGSGKMAVRKGLDRGRERWFRGSGEDSTMMRGLQRGLNDGTCPGEVDDSVGSREIFGEKIWQPDGMSESLWGLGFAKAVQWFIYRGTKVATGINDIIGAIATENHSSDGPLPSSDRC